MMPTELREALEDEHADYIKDQRNALEQHLQRAMQATGMSVRTVQHLASNQIYDVEYAESGDVLRLLEMAHSALAGAQAIAEGISRG